MKNLKSDLFSKFESNRIADTFKVVGGIKYSKSKGGAHAGQNDIIDGDDVDWTGSGTSDCHPDSSWG